MALLTFEGFDRRNGGKSSWSSLGTSSSYYVPGRFGGEAYSTTADCSFYPPALAPGPLYIGSARQVTSISDILMQIDYAAPTTSSDDLSFTLDSTRRLSVRRNGSTGTVLATTAAPLTDANSVWCYLEMMVLIDATGGRVVVKADGVTVIDYTGNTQSEPGSGTITRVLFNSTNYFPLDDVYICDSTGEEFNNFLGEVQVETLVPNGSGTYSQLVGTDGNSVDNYLLVDEATPSETDHVASETVGAKDTYVFSDVTLPGQILAVQPTAAISKSYAGDAAARLVTKLGPTETVSEDFIASNMKNRASAPQTRDPNGAPWTAATVNAAEFGVEVR
jgi:hypothetical protein